MWSIWERIIIKNALRAKQLDVTLYQRPRAENNLAVACASIIARYNFVNEMKKMSEHYSFTFPKGSTKIALEAAKNFVSSHGKEHLRSVAKLHFKLTDMIED